MATIVPESELPTDLSVEEAVEVAYSRALAEISDDLVRGLPVLVECEKDLAPYLYMSLRARLKRAEVKCAYLDGRPKEDKPDSAPVTFVSGMLEQLRSTVRGAVEKRVAALPHLDLLTTSQGGITAEAREVVPLLYENPDLVWLGFKDPSFPLPKVIENLFPRRRTILGIPRDRLSRLVTQREARKFGRGLNAWGLYKYVSGMNAARLRRLLASMEGEDYPSDPKRAYQRIRGFTVQGALEIPTVDLDADIGGYEKVKTRIRREIVEVLSKKDELTDEAAVQRMEKLIPRGMIFWGPPGTGKTLFAKGIAASIGAAITVVSGPELKSRWVGESEENLRQIFHQARQSAPSIIVFDELDSFASARGTYTGSGVEHSMVNQLLTEMDGFRNDELVFVVGTTNFVEILDPALLRPGRFEFHLQIPHPDSADRRAILKIYDEKLELRLTAEATDFAVKRTGDYVEGAPAGTRFTGDHINALCRALARIRLREGLEGPTDELLVDRALSEYAERPQMSPREERVVAIHEAGHAICALFSPHAPTIDRISIRGDMAGALGFVRYRDPDRKYVVTRGELLDDLCILMGGREAEKLLLDDLSIGSAGDLDRATEIAHAVVEEFGMGGDETGVVRYMSSEKRRRREDLSPAQLERLDRAVLTILEEARTRAAAILESRRPMVVALADLLLERKVVEAKTLGERLELDDVARKKLEPTVDGRVPRHDDAIEGDPGASRATGPATAAKYQTDSPRDESRSD
ncbi:MAG TPA: AAA family ATPase [Pirellulaceae bacterium]|jgi:cell division protease FtsH|nr:AAA family ATPase [Pirellulaceae bacterium]